MVPLIANLRLWRRVKAGNVLARWEGGTPRDWLGGAVRLTFIAAVIAFGLSPVNISKWNAFPIFAFAVLPVVFVVEALTRTRWSRWVTGATFAYVVIACGVLLAATASEVYRNQLESDAQASEFSRTTIAASLRAVSSVEYLKSL